MPWKEFTFLTLHLYVYSTAPPTSLCCKVWAVRTYKRSGFIILRWHCCALNLSVINFSQVHISVTVIPLLQSVWWYGRSFWNILICYNASEGGRLCETNIRNRNNWTMYNMYKFFKDIFEQPENFNNIIVHKTQELAVQVYGVHCRTGLSLGWHIFGRQLRGLWICWSL